MPGFEDALVNLVKHPSQFRFEHGPEEEVYHHHGKAHLREAILAEPVIYGIDDPCEEGLEGEFLACLYFPTK